jgi:hypothetical protein
MSFQSNTQPLIGGSPDTDRSRLWFDVMTMIGLIDNETFGLEKNRSFRITPVPVLRVFLIEVGIP